MKLGIEVGAGHLMVVLGVDLMLPALGSSAWNFLLGAWERWVRLGIQNRTDFIQLVEFNVFQTAASYRM